MVKPKNNQPTERELQILSILWDIGPATVREVNKYMNEQEKTGYTTTLKLMQIMVEKGLLERDESKFKHIYSPSVNQEDTQSQVVGNLVDKLFSGSAEKLVMRALSSKKVSPEELENIKKLINNIEEGK